MSDDVSRRELLQGLTMAGGLAAMGAVWSDTPPRPSRSPNARLNIASIGVGGMGANDVASVGSENIVALCDVDDARAAATFERFPKAARYRDFREMLDKEGKQIDAVTVSTPDHCHAVASAMAMKMGKHVYCQKPVAHLVGEARRMKELARKHRVVTQMGTQGHPSYTRLVEYIQKGVIGPVTEVHAMTDRPAGWWPQGVARPTGTPAPPSSLDWDLWLGPAPGRPYNPAYLPFVWRGWWDFGTGAMGDMGCHILDGAFWALGLREPLTIEAEGDPHMPETGPLTETIRWEFPARGAMPPVTLHWYDGGRRIPENLLHGQSLGKDWNGSIFVGEKGTILQAHGADPMLLPEKDFRDFRAPDPYLPRSPGHYIEWINACKTGGPTGSNFEYACTMTEAVLLGNVAFRLGRKIEWDVRAMRVKGCPEADAMLRPNYRKGYSL